MTKNARITLALSTCLCLVPTVVGLILWNKLPNTMAIHWGIDMQPNGWMPKPLVVFMLPLFLAALDAVVIAMTERGLTNVQTPKVAAILYWVVPAICVSMMGLTYGAALNEGLNVGRYVLLILGFLFVVVGNYTPKMSYETARVIHHPAPRNEAVWRKQARFIGFVLVAVGFGSLVAAFFV